MGRVGPLGHPLSPGPVNGGLGPAPLAQLDFFFLPKHAMSVIGFSEEEIRQVLEVTALVLKLGNVKLTDEFQANGIPASGICDGKGWCYLPGAHHESLTLSPVCEPPPT